MNFKRKIFYFRNEVNNETTKIVYSFIYAAFFVLALSFSDLTLKAESTNQNVQLQDIFSRSETKILKVDFEQSQKKRR